MIARNTFLLLIALITLSGPVSAEYNIYVNGSAGSDSNNGTTVEAPWKTLEKAAPVLKKNKAENVDTTLHIAEGTYREGILQDWAGKPDSTSRLTIQGEGDVVIKGSDQWNDGWTSEGDGIFSHRWDANWGVQKDPWKKIENAVVLRREMIFVDGKLLKQYLALDELTPSSFFVDETANKISVKLEADISEVDVEVAVRHTAVGVREYNNLEIRGLKVQHFANLFQTGAVSIYNSHDILIEDSEFSWNNDKGFNVGILKPFPGGINNPTIRRVINNNNGLHGFGFSSTNNGLLEDVESSYNNWRGNWGGWHVWSVSNKIWSSRDLVVRRFVSRNNFACGLWFDMDHVNALVEDSEITGNLRQGIYLEISQGPITIKNSLIKDNQWEGIYLSNVKNVTLEGNIITDNYAKELSIKGMWDRDTRAAQILVVGRNDGRTVDVRDGANQIIYTEDLKLRGNLISGKTKYLIATWHDHPNYKIFLNSLDSDCNTWQSDHVKRFLTYRNKHVPLSVWQATTGQDKNSSIYGAPPKCETK